WESYPFDGGRITVCIGEVQVSRAGDEGRETNFSKSKGRKAFHPSCSFSGSVRHQKRNGTTEQKSERQRPSREKCLTHRPAGKRRGRDSSRKFFAIVPPIS